MLTHLSQIQLPRVSRLFLRLQPWNGAPKPECCPSKHPDRFARTAQWDCVRFLETCGSRDGDAMGHRLPSPDWIDVFHIGSNDSPKVAGRYADRFCAHKTTVWLSDKSLINHTCISTCPALGLLQLVLLNRPKRAVQGGQRLFGVIIIATGRSTICTSTCESGNPRPTSWSSCWGDEFRQITDRYAANIRRQMAVSTLLMGDTTTCLQIIDHSCRRGDPSIQTEFVDATDSSELRVSSSHGTGNRSQSSCRLACSFGAGMSRHSE